MLYIAIMPWPCNIEAVSAPLVKGVWNAKEGVWGKATEKTAQRTFKKTANFFILANVLENLRSSAINLCSLCIAKKLVFCLSPQKSESPMGLWHARATRALGYFRRTCFIGVCQYLLSVRLAFQLALRCSACASRFAGGGRVFCSFRSHRGD